MIDRVAFLGFLPWVDERRAIEVRRNPSILAATRAAELWGQGASVIGVEVSIDGIVSALEKVRGVDARIVVAAGQTPTEPRIERFGRVPMALSSAVLADGPWLLAPDVEELVALVNRESMPEAALAPFRGSDDAGAYFCDHLCVELARLQAMDRVRARFLHVTAIDGVESDVAAARVEQYARQLVAVARHLGAGRSPEA